MSEGWLRLGDEHSVAAGGDWVVATAGGLDAAIAQLTHTPTDATTHLDMSGVERLDTAGAALVLRLKRDLGHRGDVAVTSASAEHAALMALVDHAHAACPPTPPHRNPAIVVLDRIGRHVMGLFHELGDMTAYLGQIVVALGRAAVHPHRIRWTSVFYHIEQVGLNAIPIVGLMAFLIGIVLAFQGADQLKRFGAEIFAVNLLGISILRELGVLLTAIIIAGRSGSSFTAQIGTMRVNEEIDALETLGLDPIDVLVLPRIMALFVALPLLTFLANMLALAGGGLMLIVTLDIPLVQFMTQLQSAVSFSTFVVGLVKAPVFALMIGMVGCYEGLKVRGSAESVGLLTTQSVVNAIFFVIVVDALFSVLFLMIGI